MENRCDLLERMGSYSSRFVSVLLDDPSDLVRASVVSRSWRRFGEHIFNLVWPVYSAKFVRFRMGSSKLPLVPENYVSDENEGRLVADDNYIWTYSSPEFPLLQENILQSFKLPRPVLCIGGVLKIELLGRVQKQVIDDLYYICVSHVEVLGRTLSPKLAVDSLEASDTSVLKYFPDAEVAPSSWTENILNALLRPLQLTEKVEESTEQSFCPIRRN